MAPQKHCAARAPGRGEGEGGGQSLVEVCAHLAAMEIDICARVCSESGGGGGGGGCRQTEQV